MMKRCPTCNQTYTDDTQSFCLTDGAPLVSDANASAQNSQSTLVYPSAANTAPQGSPATNPLYSQQSAPNWSQPPTQQFATAQPKTRSVLFWVIGVFLLLFVLAGAVVVAAFVIYLRSKPSRTNVNVPRPVVSNTKSSSTTNGNNSNDSTSTGTDYSARKGSYTGTATNTTNSPAATGDAEIEITEINNLTGAMKMKMKFTGGLCGAGESFGVIDKKTGETSLFGSLVCDNTTWIMTTRCTFPSTDTLNCTYRLTAASQPQQVGRFEVTK